MKEYKIRFMKVQEEIIVAKTDIEAINKLKSIHGQDTGIVETTLVKK